MFKKVMVPLDGSRSSSKSVGMAEAIARKFDSELILLRVVPSVSVSPAGVGAADSISLYEMAAEAAAAENALELKRARNQLNSRRRRLESNGISARAEVFMGDPADAIEKFARQEKVELIVMATRARGGIARALLGSVADHVVHSSVAPVLLIKR